MTECANNNKNCLNCSHCINCTDCINCENCSKCVNCYGCTCCYNCMYCDSICCGIRCIRLTIDETTEGLFYVDNMQVTKEAFEQELLKVCEDERPYYIEYENE